MSPARLTAEQVFAARLQYAMETRRMSARRLASLLGTSSKVTAGWRAGRHTPKLGTLAPPLRRARR